MEEKLIKKMEESITNILDSGLNTNNLDTLYKLSKIKHMTKEDMEMNYNGRGPGYETYGDYYRNYRGYDDNYRARGRDMRYRGHDYLDEMHEDYSRYMEGRERYGANEDTRKSLKYMLKSMEDFARMLKEDAQNEEEVEMIRQTAQRIAQM